MAHATTQIEEEDIVKTPVSDGEEGENRDASNLAAEVDIIAARIAVREFPVVFPATNEEKESLMGRMTEAVEIQSHMHGRFALFMKDNPSRLNLKSCPDQDTLLA